MYTDEIEFQEVVQGQLPGYMHNGKFYPAVMGGSGLNTADLNEDGTDDDDTADQGSDDYSLANGFLADIPEEHRPIVEQYVKEWDSQVGKKFQEVHGTYAPYKELGVDPDQLREAWESYQFITENPELLYKKLAEIYGTQAPQGQETVPAQQISQQVQGLPPELQQQLAPFFEETQQVKQVVESLASYFLAQQEAERVSREDAELDEGLAQLHEKYGDFDENYVLFLAMKNGGDGDKAVKEYQQMVQGLVNQSHAPTAGLPTVLSGGGSVPGQVQNVTELSNDDVKKLVAETLAAAAQANG